MADNRPMLASAVVIPNAPEPADSQRSDSPRSPTLKRRQSSISESSSKRPRLSVDRDGHGPHGRDSSGPTTGLPTPTDESHDNRPTRRRTGLEEEKGRGKRLFGALLGTLSQGSVSSAAQRRRADIEKKQQAKLQQQAAEFEQRRKERLGEILEARHREQRKFEEQSMRIRHSNMLAMAHFLQTKAEPKLYYKPWELSADEEDIIEAQVAEVETIIDRELEEFEAARRAERAEESNGDHHESHNNQISTDVEIEKGPNLQNGHVQDGADENDAEGSKTKTAETSREQVNDQRESEPQTPMQETKHEHDDDEEIMEGEEDAVLY